MKREPTLREKSPTFFEQPFLSQPKLVCKSFWHRSKPINFSHSQMVLRLAGDVACPFFARAERLALATNDSCPNSVTISNHTSVEFDVLLQQLLQNPGWATEYASQASQQSDPQRMIAWNDATGALIGYEPQFRRLIRERYGVCIAEPATEDQHRLFEDNGAFAQLRAVAQENVKLRALQQKWLSGTTEGTEQSKRRPKVSLLLVGPRASTNTEIAQIISQRVTQALFPMRVVSVVQQMLASSGDVGFVSHCVHRHLCLIESRASHFFFFQI